MYAFTCRLEEEVHDSLICQSNTLLLIWFLFVKLVVSVDECHVKGQCPISMSMFHGVDILYIYQPVWFLEQMNTYINIHKLYIMYHRAEASGLEISFAERNDSTAGNQPTFLTLSSQVHIFTPTELSKNTSLFQARSIFLKISKKPYVSTQQNLGGGFKHFLFSPLLLGKMNPFWLAHICSNGFVKNHHLEMYEVHFNLFFPPFVFPEQKSNNQLFPTFDYWGPPGGFVFPALCGPATIGFRSVYLGVGYIPYHPCLVYLPTFRLIFMVNVGKYTSPMDDMGMWGYHWPSQVAPGIRNFWRRNSVELLGCDVFLTMKECGFWWNFDMDAWANGTLIIRLHESLMFMVLYM